MLGFKQFSSPALIRDWPKEIVNDNWYGIGPPVLKPFTTLDSSFLNTVGKSAENMIMYSFEIKIKPEIIFFFIGRTILWALHARTGKNR